ncbi:MAG: DUF1501 domain-containing protein, partial [Planctomycetales bacterium]
MFDVGTFRAATCGGLNRRSFLKIGASIPAGLSMAGMNQIAQAAEGAKAKSVMLLWLWGGPAHTDMFDPKPDAPLDYRGPFATIPTKLPGVRFTEIL